MISPYNELKEQDNEIMQGTLVYIGTKLYGAYLCFRYAACRFS